MKVEIAGFNIDKSLLDKIATDKVFTPETISAAYARISRSKKSISELRKQALREIEQARNSNQNIIFEMGHSSIAEHAVFNIDIVGVSRLLVETIERSRLASFTEKSQRYVTLEGDFLVPAEIRGTSLENEFRDMISQQNQLYQKLYETAQNFLKTSGFCGTHTELLGKAKEDARYVLSLATQTQLGMTINARSISRLLRRLDRTDLAEASELKEILEEQVKKTAPSLIRYTQSDAFEQADCSLTDIGDLEDFSGDVQILSSTPDPDDLILSGLLFSGMGGDFSKLAKSVNNISSSEKQEIYSRLFSEMKSFHSVPKAFELVQFLFQINMSASCFGQFKRHRLCTILKSHYHPDRGYVVPPLLADIGMQNAIAEIMNKSARVFHLMESIKSGLGAYILTNAHRLSVLFQANLRELYHFSRLRSDRHAQWEIQQISHQIDVLVKSHAPLSAQALMGKDEFNSK